MDFLPNLDAEALGSASSWRICFSTISLADLRRSSRAFETPSGIEKSRTLKFACPGSAFRSNGANVLLRNPVLPAKLWLLGIAMYGGNSPRLPSSCETIAPSAGNRSPPSVCSP